MDLPKKIIDIETNLAHDTIWCAVTMNLDGSDTWVHTSPSTLPSPDEFSYIAHNGVTFDFPKLAELWDFVVPEDNQIDTILLSKLYDTNIPGGHSLANLAKCAGGKELKDDFPLEAFDWGYTEEMASYCKQDCKALGVVYSWLERKMRSMGYSDDCIRLEHTVRRLTNIQQRNGFKLDIERASALYTNLYSKQRDIEEQLQKVFPPIVTERYSEKQIDKATGKPKRLKDDVEVFNVGSRQQIARRLEGLGVKWSKRTEKGAVKVDEKTLAPLAKKWPEAGMCLDYLTHGKTASMVDSWLKHTDEDTGRIYGKVDTLGAVTGRMTHSTPNLAQVKKGGETRSCFTVEDGNVLVGVDASGLELRMLAHYMQDEDYIDLVLNGDIHSYNQKAAGLETRDQAKTFIYAFLYGAGDAKIGSIIGGGKAAGKRLKEEFLANTPALKQLREKIGRMSKQGHLPGLDGRRIRVRSEHAALNTLLQGAGAIIMKRALVIGDADLEERRIWHKLVAQVHDELQTETKRRYGQTVGDAYVKGIVEAGEYYDMRIPLAGESMIGNSWADTH